MTIFQPIDRDLREGVADTLTVGIVGLGYVGLPTALAFFRSEIRVVGLDVSEERLRTIRVGQPDLLPSDHDRLRDARESDTFVLTSDPRDLASCDLVIVCVPTPIDEFEVPDLRALRGACESLVKIARPGQSIVLTSTSYVGSTRDLLVAPLEKRGFTPGQDIFVAFSPERIDPANTKFGQEDVPRVIGGTTLACTAKISGYLSLICGGMHEVSSIEAAEMTKLLENTFRAVNISLANEFAEAANVLGIDPIEVVQAAATKPFGFMPFYPGPGVGGHCIPCDPHYLLWQLRKVQMHPSVTTAAMQGISTRPARIVERAAEVLAARGKSISGAKVLLAGVAYKPDVADVRESPALRIIEGLVHRGADVAIYDTHVEGLELEGEYYITEREIPHPESYDLVLVACLHSTMDERVFTKAQLVLDATYQLPAAPNRLVP